MSIDVSGTNMSALSKRLVMISLAALAGTAALSAQNSSPYFLPDNLVISRSVYDNNANNVMVGATLPPNCAVPSRWMSVQ